MQVNSKLSLPNQSHEEVPDVSLSPCTLCGSAVESTQNASHAKTQLKLSQSVARCGNHGNHAFHAETTKAFPRSSPDSTHQARHLVWQSQYSRTRHPISLIELIAISCHVFSQDRLELLRCLPGSNHEGPIVFVCVILLYPHVSQWSASKLCTPRWDTVRLSKTGPIIPPVRQIV